MYSMGNKEELEIYVWSQGYDLFVMTEHGGIDHVTEMLSWIAKSVWWGSGVAHYVRDEL